VTALQVVQGVVYAVALVWLLVRLARAPRVLPLRAVTGAVAAWTLAYPFGIAADQGARFLGLPAMVCRLVDYGLLVVGGYALVCVFLSAALAGGRVRGRALVQAAPPVVTLAVLVGAVLAMPPELRTAAAMVPTEASAGPVGVPSVALFYLATNTYLLYAFAAAWWWTGRYARTAEPRLARGLRVARVGLVGIVFGLAVFVSANVARWAGGALPRPLVFAGIFVLLPGILLFVGGVSYPAAAMRAAASRIWWQHLRAYHRMGPLWTLLHERFPQDALVRAPARSGWRELSLRGVHRRYYRRAVECRDGLVRISPYLARELDGAGSDGAAADPVALADGLRRALIAHAAGAAAPSRAVPVAIPAAEGLAADVHELVALSQALRA
jgi:hypothetical protein